MQEKPNIILITADSLRANHLGCYQYPLPTSPHIDKLACEGVLCENMFAPGIPTQPSHTTIFTGQHPVTHGVVAHGGKARLTRGSPWLPEICPFTSCSWARLAEKAFQRGNRICRPPVSSWLFWGLV